MTNQKNWFARLTHIVHDGTIVEVEIWVAGEDGYYGVDNSETVHCVWKLH